MFARDSTLVREWEDASSVALTLETHGAPSSCGDVCLSNVPSRKPRHAKNVVHATLATPVFPDRDFSLLVKEADDVQAVAVEALQGIYALGRVDSEENLERHLPAVLNILEEGVR